MKKTYYYNIGHLNHIDEIRTAKSIPVEDSELKQFIYQADRQIPIGSFVLVENINGVVLAIVLGKGDEELAKTFEHVRYIIANVSLFEEQTATYHEAYAKFFAKNEHIPVPQLVVQLSDCQAREERALNETELG